MAKASVSAPDPSTESDEESREGEPSSEEEVNAAGFEFKPEPVPEPESRLKKLTDNALPIKKPPSTPVPDAKNPEPQTSDSSSEEPIVSNPMDGDAQKDPALKTPKSKHKTAALSSTSKKPNTAVGGKRPATSETGGGDGEVTETKRSKKKLKKEIEESDKKSSSRSRKLFRRLWSEEDEIAILEGMADFSANKRTDPFTNLDVFHEIIKKSIHVDVSKTQLQDKIHKMRKKFLDNAYEKQGSGIFSINYHERKVFELSKKVWSDETFSAAGRTIASPKKKSSSNKRSRKFFQRVWSEEDEIAILEGMADFSANKKADPFTNLDVFYEIIKKSIHVDVSKTQLQDKIHKMRKKFLDDAYEKQGPGNFLMNDHELKVFGLSKKVWNDETFSVVGTTIESPKINGDSDKRSSSKNVKSKKAVTDVKEEGRNNLDSSSQGLDRLKSVNLGAQKLGIERVNLGAQKLGIEEWIMQNSIQLVDGESRTEMDDKWRRFRTEDAELYCKRLELVLEEAKLVVDALRSSRD